MDEQKLREQLRHAAETRLSGLEGDPWLTQRVLANAKGEVKVKKKMSVGFVLVLILALVTVTALAAALLSAKDVVEQQAVPMANQYDGESYTAEDTNILVKLAEENGIQISEPIKEQIQAALDKGKGYFKEELLMALAKAEFGENPASWMLEQQKWFDDVCVAIGFTDENQKAFPSTGEDAKIEIMQAAMSHILKKYNSSAPLNDTSKYNVGAQYLNGDVDGEYTGMYWSIIYTPLYVEGGEYWVYLRDDGTVIGDIERPGLQASSTTEDVLHNYETVFGSYHTWTQTTFRSFKAACMKAKDTDSRAYLCMKQTTYPEIPDNAIRKEEAFALAEKGLGVETFRYGHAFFIGAVSNPVWKVTLVHDADDIQWSVEVDCVTGEIKATQMRDGLHRSWWMSIVLWEVSDSVDADWVDNTPSVG